MKLGKFVIKKEGFRKPEIKNATEIAAQYAAGISAGKQLVLGTLSGRSGTRWLCDVFAHHKNATGVTERNSGPEAYYRFIKYNNLPIDTAGIITTIQAGIVRDWEQADISLVFSPYFSHGIAELRAALSPSKIIFAISEPEFTVQSMYNKGLFQEHYERYSSADALGYQAELGDRWSHYFGRIVPNGEGYSVWKEMTRIGKIAWFANRIVADIDQQLQGIPAEEIFIFNLQDASGNYEYYKKMAAIFNLQPLLSQEKFSAIEKKWFKQSHNIRHQWSAQERAEFESETKAWQAIYEKLNSK